MEPPRPHIVLAPELSYVRSKTRVEFHWSCFKQNKAAFNHGTIVNIYIVYELMLYNSNSNYPASENCLFGAVGLTKNADIDKHEYSGYGIGFNKHGSFHFLALD